MVIQPDTARIFVGESLQFKALGFDADSNYIMVSPDPVWSVSGTHAQINAAGVFTSDTAGQYTITGVSDSLSATAFMNVLGNPVLTRIEIKPDTVTVPVGASQQFSAKGFDQYNTQVPLTDTIFWSVTGSNNTMSANGLMTAGNTPGTYTITATSGTISGTLPITVGYTCTVNNRYEAETASSYAAGPSLVTTNDVSGGQHFEGITAGKWFAYSNLKVPSAGRYNIRLRVSTTAAAKIKIGHGTFTFRIIDVPSTGGQWQTISDTLTLPALSYTGVHAVSGTFKFNWFAIDNCAQAPVPAARIQVTPDTILLAVGSTYRFAAAGFDVNNQPALLPGLQWSVNGTGNTIDSAGWLTAGAAPGWYPVIATSGSLADTAWVNIAACTVNTKYEAESFSARHSGPILETCTDVGGGQDFTGLAAGHYFAYNTLNVPAAGLYRISFRVASTAPAQIRVGHSSFTFGIKAIPSTGGQWQTITDTITLPALSYTGIHVVSGTFKFNWFTIDNCAMSSGNGNGNRMAMVVPGEAESNETDETVLYPNPTTGPLTIVPGSRGYQTFTVTDAGGRLVQRWTINPNQSKINKDISALKAGVYILTLEGTHKIKKSIKIIKQ
jgi:hypothetical protein